MLCLQSLWSSVSGSHTSSHPYSPEHLRPLVLVLSSSHKGGRGFRGEGQWGQRGRSCRSPAASPTAAQTLGDPTQTICKEGCGKDIQGQPKTQMKGMTHAGGLGERTTLASHLQGTDIHLTGRGSLLPPATLFPNQASPRCSQSWGTQKGLPQEAPRTSLVFQDKRQRT